MKTEEKFMKKKGVAIAIPSPGPSPSRSIDESEDEENLFSSAVLRFFTRNASSKYNFVKVKVWLGDNANHYYIFSKFLLSRMLTVTKVVSNAFSTFWLLLL
ncbi:hypothetical protein LguiB_025164 [Lonicera macranthoides]